MSVQNCGLAVLEQTVLIEGAAHIGDARGAVVRYAGDPVLLEVVDGQLWAGQQILVPGRPHQIQERPVRVMVERVAPDGFEVQWPAFDPRMFVATVAIVLFAWWLDAIGTFVPEHPSGGQPAVAQGVYIP